MCERIGPDLTQGKYQTGNRLVCYIQKRHKQNRLCLFFCTRQESNLRPFGPEPNALSPELRVLMYGAVATTAPFPILPFTGTDVKSFSPSKYYSSISTVGKFQISSAY